MWRLVLSVCVGAAALGCGQLERVKQLNPREDAADAGGASSTAVGPTPAASPRSSGPDGGSDGARPSDAGQPGAAPANWTEMSPPGAPNEGATITDLWAADDDDLFIGEYLDCARGSDACSGRVPLVFRWRRGAGWDSEPGLPASGWTPMSIHGTSAQDVWAVGGDAMYHRGADGWSLVDPSWQMAIGASPGVPISLQSVRAFPGGQVWAVSPKFILHRADGIWSATLIPPAPDAFTPGSGEQYLERLWAFSPDEVWVSGYWAYVGSTMTPAFLCRAESPSLDCIAPTDGSNRGVTGLFGEGDGRVWASVSDYSDNHGNSIPFERIDWNDGKSVTAAAIDGWWPNDAIGLYSMWGRADDDVWAVGTGSGQSAGPVVVHFDGGHWTKVPAPTLAAKEWCALASGGTRTFFVATSTGRVFRLDRPAAP